MDINVSVGSAAVQQPGAMKPRMDAPLSVPGKVSNLEVKTPETTMEILPIPANTQEAENARMDVLKEAAVAQANFYPVGENTIAIYRNLSNGEMVFRMRNLKTGEIKEIPEQRITDFMRHTHRGSSLGVGIDV